MRRLIIVALGMALAACKHEAAAPAGKQATPAVELVSVLNVNAPQAATQLTSGFYQLEASTWRWTAKKFSVTLRPPAGSAATGARLDLKLTLAEAILKALGPMTLSATAGGVALQPETYTKPGDYTYSRDVPASVLSGDRVLIEFATDKAQAPAVDVRELALVVTKVGLVTK